MSDETRHGASGQLKRNAPTIFPLFLLLCKIPGIIVLRARTCQARSIISLVLLVLLYMPPALLGAGFYIGGVELRGFSMDGSSAVRCSLLRGRSITTTVDTTTTTTTILLYYYHYCTPEYYCMYRLWIQDARARSTTVMMDLLAGYSSITI